MAEELLHLPFTGLWMAQNSPARRVPSHGAMDRVDPSNAEGLPIAFRMFREWRSGPDQPVTVEAGIPGEWSIVEPFH